ncbi:MAG TPA: hypothetical protein VFM79_12885 [Pelobium sp.]|nr:hypothetical protein [Pelobium sp.]
MSFKTYLIIFLSVAITVIFMQNLEPVAFNILWMEFMVAKLVMMLVVTVFGFILGVMVARPRKKKLAESAVSSIPFEVHQPEGNQYSETKQKRDLSEEDKDYLN